jgi:putative transposase
VTLIARQDLGKGMERSSLDADESTSTWCGSFSSRGFANKQAAQMKHQKRASQAQQDARSS